MRARWAAAALVVMGLLFLIAAGTSSARKSVTVDEFGHLPVGYNVLRTGDYRYAELNPPLLTALAALPVLAMDPPRSNALWPGAFRTGFEAGFRPWHNGYVFMFEHRDHYHEVFVAARWVTIALVLGLGVLAFFWARSIAGHRRDFAGLLAAGLVWSSPNVMAHARLVTTDAGLACLAALALFGLHAMLRQPTLWRTIGFGTALGLAQLAKFTAVYLYPLTVLVAGVWAVWHSDTKKLRLIGCVALAIAVSLVVLNAGYQFRGSGMPLDQHELVSEQARGLQAALPGALPVPLPREYVAAFDRQLRDVATGDQSYLFGESYYGGRWDYFFWLLLFKVPIPVLALGLLGLWACVRSRPTNLTDSAVLLLPAAVFVGMFSFLSNKQLGLRLILPALPLAFVWTAATLAQHEWKRPARWALALLIGWTGVEALSTHPDYLSYFNQLAGGSSKGHEIALDSNVDWGQDLPLLAEYMEENEIDSIQLLYFGRVDPAIYGIEYEIPSASSKPGYAAISVSRYGLEYPVYDHGHVRKQGPVRVDWNTTGPPVATLGGSIQIYRVE